MLHERGLATGVGDEGGFAPDLESTERAIETILEAAERAGHRERVAIALDPAASEVFRDGAYHLPGEGRTLEPAEMIDFYRSLAERFPLVSIEDGLDENAWGDWRDLTQAIGDDVQLVGDDLFVTNVDFLRRGIDERVGNAILVKVNQIGTLTESLDVIEMARDAGYATVISHRSGRDGGHDDRRPGRRRECRPDQDRARRRAPTASRSTTSSCASRRSSVTKRCIPVWSAFRGR